MKNHFSPGDVGCLPIGLSLSKLATSKSTVCNSENVKILSPMEALIARFTDLMRASVTPFYQGASADVKIHSNPSVTPKPFRLFQSQFLVMLESSLFAATSWVRLSENSLDG